MQELEKILEEIETSAVYAETKDGYGAMCVSKGTVERIIRKHMNDTHGCTARKAAITMTEREVIKIFENEVIILDCWIEHCKDIIADCETEDDEFDDDKEREELSLKDYTERKEAFDVAISALKEIQQYREIGTVEEFREAVEKQKPKKPILRNDNGKLRKSCPVCGCFFSPLSRSCPKCGQAILWENEDD